MKRKTLIALAVASLFAAPLAYAASSPAKTWDRPVFASMDAIPDQQEDNADLIRLPNPVLITEDEKKEGESSQLIAEDEKKEGGESTQLIADSHEEKKEGESSQLIA